MATKEEEYNKIVLYIQQYLVHNTMVAEDANEGYEVLSAGYIKNLQKDLPYQGYAESKGRGKKINIKQFLTEDWKKFWNTWPSTKSVPGTQYKSGAKMKGQELKMHEKWYNAIYEHEKITLEKMQYAAECYLQWAYEDSKRLCRNELHYRNSMEPWLNQEQYLLFKDVEMPIKSKPVPVYQNSIDM